MKRILILLTFATLFLPQIVFAQQSTLLPQPTGILEEDEAAWNNLSDDEKSEKAKLGITNACEYSFNQSGTVLFEDSSYYKSSSAFPEDQQDILVCAIRSGRVHLWMIPYFIKYFANFFIGIAGTVSLLFVLLGGFWYMAGGVTDDKEKGKKTITYALVGMSITLLAWIFVNVIMVQITG